MYTQATETTRTSQADPGGMPGFPVVSDVWGLRTLIANVYFVGAPDAGEWVLVDAGLPYSAGAILEAAEARFGAGSSPRAVVLTHGHFDHIGALTELVERWGVSVYAHKLELPYLTGRSDYPPPDPTVGGGLMARAAPLYPRRGIDLGGRIRALPEDGSVPPLPGWRALHTPGHTPGHISLFRDDDRTLLAGDAFITVKQESALAVLTQRKRVHGPPAYFTPNWPQARASVERLAALSPHIAATGHGLPMRGARLTRELGALTRDFNRLAVPARGRYVRESAVADERGTVYVPPPAPDSLTLALLGVGAATIAGVTVALLRGRSRR